MPRDVALLNDPLLLLAAEDSREQYLAHLAGAHPAEYARVRADEQAMDDALAAVFGRKQ